MQVNTAHQNKSNPTKNDRVAIQQRQEALLCFSHLRWNFVYQRPQHLMTRFATQYDIIYIEEPIYIEKSDPQLVISKVANDILIVVPHLTSNISREKESRALLYLLKDLIQKNEWHISIKWYLTPMMLAWTKFIASDITVYDCMDELSAFKNAPPQLKKLEQELLQQADLVFTGGDSLYKAKNPYHRDVHLFPSSVDVAHFLQARSNRIIPDDQKYIPEPRIGFYGVIDERLDIKLLQALASSRPEWNFVLVGPVVKIDIRDLPQLKNIHYLGAKAYEELPYYLSGWDIAFIPFALNESTKFISPTKTPEYIAAGKPVVSTPITDIVMAYHDSEIVHIADPGDLLAFINAIELALEDSKNREKIYSQAEFILQNLSWDKTFLEMHNLILVKQQKGFNNAK